MAAAPNACTTSRVRTIESRFTLGASSTPDRHTKVDPTTHAARRTAMGEVPVIASSVGSSTTPRMATPSRDTLEEHREHQRRQQRDCHDQDLPVADHDPGHLDRVGRQVPGKCQGRPTEPEPSSSLRDQDEADGGGRLQRDGDRRQASGQALHQEAEDHDRRRGR